MFLKPPSNTPLGDKEGTLSQRVYAQLKQNILNCDLKPGQLVNESELIKKYEVSKTPVREALKRLSQERYIQSVPGTCYFVAPITLREIVEICELRTILEEAAVVRAATTITDTQLRELEEKVGAEFVAETRDELVRWYRINNDFHLALAKLSGNARIEQVLRECLEALTRYLLLDRKLPWHNETWILQHQRIVEALKTRDTELARRAIRMHMDDAKAAIEQSLLAGFARTTT